MKRVATGSCVLSGLLLVAACGGGGGGSAPPVAPPPPPVTAKVSGSLLVPADARPDSDTNTSLATPLRNDGFATAQRLPNPVLLGGYANAAGSGPAGPLQAAGDLDDYYRVSLLQGQTIELSVAGAAEGANDLDLELYSAAGQLLDGSYGTRQAERLVAGASGEHYVRVLAASGASLYSLSIGRSAATTAAAPALSDPFVPGQLLLRAARRVGDLRGTAKVAADAAARHALKPLAGGPEREWLLELTSGALDGLRVAQQAGRSAADPVQFASAEQRRKWATLQALKLVAADPDLAWVEPNWIATPAAVPGDPLYPRQRWHYELVQLPAAWDITMGSAAVTVAVVDTGIRPHPDLDGQRRGGYDFVRGPASGDGDGLDPDPTDLGDRLGANLFHGTHVAGTIAAATNDGYGVTGIAPGVRLMPLRVVNMDRIAEVADMVQAVRYAAGLPNDSGSVPPVRADVINVSISAAIPCPASLADAIAAARGAGSIVVAAAGNSNRDQDTFPAGCPGVVGVGAVDALARKASYSNYGRGVDLAAPGGQIGDDRDGDGYGDGVFSTHARKTGAGIVPTHDPIEGSSMAAPHVSAALALMRSLDPALTPAAIDQLLARGALTVDIGAPGPDTLGVGLISAFKAVQAATGGVIPPRPGQLTASHASLSFGAALAELEVAVGNAGTEPVRVTSITVSEPWLSVVASQVDANGLGRYLLRVDRNGLADGTYGGRAEFSGSVGSPVRIDVLVQVLPASAEADAGPQYLQLVDPDSGRVAYSFELQARGSRVAFEFTGVAAGRYLLVAGTDLDGDRQICEPGEACGRYPIYSNPTALTIAGDLAGLDFATELRPVAASATTTSTRFEP
jgi:serine protease